jgi:tRNA (guanine-N7-)-methyltransferase
MENFSNVLQVPYREIEHNKHPICGKWCSDFFKNNNPVVLELGCGKGEYTVGLARFDASKNYIGVDIKGSRMWQGASQANAEGLTNVGFLRTHIEMLSQFFGKNEVSEIWLTFPDPQMKKTRKRLTSTRFIKMYTSFLRPGGTIHLKTDSNFQYRYTLEMIKANQFDLLGNIEDIYSLNSIHPVLQIRTYYEKQWIARGISIKYLSFIPNTNTLVEPEAEIEPDTYRSFGRSAITV